MGDSDALAVVCVSLALSCVSVVLLVAGIYFQKGGGGFLGWLNGILGPPGRGGTLLDAGPIAVNIKKGMGAGKKHALDKDYTGDPFPFSGGALASFEVNFAPGYEWGCKGKLGGLYVGTGKASGGNYSDDGASHRIMWDKDGGAHAYVYIPKGSSAKQPPPLRNPPATGQDVWKQDFASAFKPGRWHRVELGVKLNTPGKSDGAMMMRVDNVTRTLGGVYWRKGNEPITKFNFQVFHGGPCDAKADSSLQFRNVRVGSWSG